jgi:hypothetical protein
MSERVGDQETLLLEDSWKSINDYFLKRDWTDGLPIIPPTEEKVYEMTEYTQKSLGWEPEEVIGILQPKQGLATVEKIATNAVMAGCKPEYMPILISVVKGIAEERFKLRMIQASTHNASILPVVNGLIRKELDINWGYNVTGSSWHSTTAIGRAIRLIITNIGGILGATNIHTQGHIARFEHCIAENEEENPWEPLHVERGFAREVSTVTIFGCCTALMIDERGGSMSTEELLNTFALSIPYVGNRNNHGEGEPLIILGPTHAGLIANGGYSKADFKRFIWERARVKFDDIPSGISESCFSDQWKKFYCSGPECRVPIAERPEDISVIVMGGKGTHSLSVQTPIGLKSVTVPITRKDGSPIHFDNQKEGGRVKRVVK